MSVELVNVNPNGWSTGKRLSADDPSPTIMRDGLGGDRWSNWELQRMPEAQRRVQANRGTTPGKPPFVPMPSMEEIRATPDCGLTHVSTFSGGGGTCIGYRMAGFRTLLANDCDPPAIACYQANLRSPIDPRPIQELRGADVLARIGLARGELDVLEGSPPCTSFSTAGKRAEGWGKKKEHAGVVQQQIEDLFFDWLRLLDELRPRAFTAENVSGMVKGVAKGYFKLVLAEMRRLGYRTEARVLDAQWLGVPQARQRVIFVGFREDTGLAPMFPQPLAYNYSVRDALPWIDLPDAAMTGFKGPGFTDMERSVDLPSLTITASDSNLGVQGRARLGLGDGSKASHVYEADRSADLPAPTIMAGDSRLGVRRDVRVVHDTHGQFPSGGNITDRPAPTISAGGAKGINSYHFTVEDGVAKRRLTIGEVKRLSSFPDDYDLSPAGEYGRQWARLGNSVPPLMAYHVARVVRDQLLRARER